MTQLDLLAQRENLARVKSKLAGCIEAFWRERQASGAPDFHAEDLLTYVRQRIPDVAPDSPRRILGELRRLGRVNYEVVDRRASLYRALPLGAQPKPRRSRLAELQQALADAHAALDAAGLPRPSPAGGEGGANEL